MTVEQFTIRLLMSVICGLLIGIERQVTGHPAGIRTNVLVSSGACMFVMFSTIVNAPDLTRVAAQLVTGVGFLGSGIIFKDGSNIRGLTTAATIWCTAAIGTLCSSGNIMFPSIATVLLLFTNIALRPISNRMQPLKPFIDNSNYYKLTIVSHKEKEYEVRAIIMKQLAKSALTLILLESGEDHEEYVKISATIFCNGKRRDSEVEEIVAKASAKEGVRSSGWELDVD